MKRLLYGAIPYYLTKIFSSHSPSLKYYKYIKDHKYSRHLYEFREEYDDMEVHIHMDESRGLHYVLKDGKRLYFRRNTPLDKIARNYRELVMEQDKRSPHHYLESIKEVTGKTFVDIGCAEGYSSLEVVEEVGHVYLFEQDELWIEALKATFSPWQEKVTIVRKYVSDHNSATEQTLDDFFKDKDKEHLFLKMDVEGAERYALAGCKGLFKECKQLDFAICTYHEEDDEAVITTFLKQFGCTYRNQKGYFRHKVRSVVLRGCKGCDVIV